MEPDKPDELYFMPMLLRALNDPQPGKLEQTLKDIEQIGKDTRNEQGLEQFYQFMDAIQQYRQ